MAVRQAAQQTAARNAALSYRVQEGGSPMGIEVPWHTSAGTLGRARTHLQLGSKVLWGASRSKSAPAARQRAARSITRLWCRSE